MLQFLLHRDNKKSFVRQIVKNIFFYANFWKLNRKNIKNQCAGILVSRVEKGMPSKDYDIGFRDGLASLPNLWASCLAETEIMKRDRGHDSFEERFQANEKAIELENNLPTDKN